MPVQLVVSYFNGQTRFYQVGPGRGWKVDAPSRCLVVGTGGLPRTYVPLDQVENFAVERHPDVVGQP